MRYSRLFALPVVLIFATTFFAASHGQMPPLEFKVDEPFPDVVLPTIDGEPSSIAQFRGTKVVLHIFASW